MRGGPDRHHVVIGDDGVDVVADLQHGRDERQDPDVAVRAGRHFYRQPMVDEVVGDEVADPVQLPHIHRVKHFGGKRLRLRVFTHPRRASGPPGSVGLVPRFEGPVFSQVAHAAAPSRSLKARTV